MRPHYPVAFVLLLAPAFIGAQAISINTDSSNPDPSAILDVKSTDKGVLVPRMTTAQRNLISAPATGLLVFDTDTGGFWFFNGTAWISLSGSGGGSYAAGPGISIVGSTISNTGDLTGADDITTGSVAGGDVTGSFFNLQIAANAVGSTEIADGSISAFDLAPGVIPTALPPNGAAGGDLTGTYPNPTVAANAIGSNEIADGAIATADLSQMGANTGQVLQWNGTAWAPAGNVNTLLQDTDADTKVQVEQNANEDILRVDLAGSERLVLKRNANAHTMLELPNNSNNIFIGTGAGNANNTGAHNVAIGTAALYNSDTQTDLVAIGDSALYNNGIGVILDPEAAGNTALGAKSLFFNTKGYQNTASGWKSLFSNTTGFLNTANGKDALRSNTTGTRNTAIGSDALHFNTTGSYNTANGYITLYSNTTGSHNTTNGIFALYSNTTGSYNTANGGEALFSNTTGNGNTALGYFADVTSGNLFNATAIGYNATVGCSNCMALGSTDATSVKVGIGISTPTHYLTVQSPDAETMRLIGPTGANGYGARMNFGNGDVVYLTEITDDELRIQANLVGIGRTPATNRLEVDGSASKSTAGDWLANSDARLKKNISPLNSHEILEKMLALQGVTYEWNDDKTGSARPEGVQYGFTAQNIQTVFPTLVEEDNLGYLQTAYGTYDAMTVEAIRALHEKITALEAENVGQKALIDLQKKQLDMQSARLDAQSAQLQQITAALQTAGIGVGN